MHRPIWVIFDGAKYLVSCRCATQRRKSNIAEHSGGMIPNEDHPQHHQIYKGIDLQSTVATSQTA